MQVPPPEAFEPPPPLEYGMTTPIFEQRTLVLIIRNHSAVPTKFNLKARASPAMAMLTMLWLYSAGAHLPLWLKVYLLWLTYAH